MSKLSKTKKVYEDLCKSMLFLSYIESKGFNSGNYEQILELNQCVKSSMSSVLREYNQFLLSTKVNYNDLEEYGINGAIGWVKRDGIFVARTKEAEKYFKGEYIPNLPYKKYRTYISLLNNFLCNNNVVISRGISKNDNYSSILNSNVDLFLGDTLDMNLESYEIKRNSLLEKLELIRGEREDLEIHIDKDSSHNKEYILLSRR